MIDFLLSTIGSELIEEVSGNAIQETLRLKKKHKDIDPKIINLCIEIAICRRKLAGLGDWVKKGFFTSRGVSQISDSTISEFRAQRFKGQRVLEIGTGLGIDTFYLSQKTKEVLTVETDLITRQFAEYNLSLRGVKNVTYFERVPDLEFDSIWADPSRRDSSGEKIKNPDNYLPPISWLSTFKKPIGIKISAAFSGLFSEFTREWIGSGFEAKEQVLWRGFDISDNTISIPPESFFINPLKEQLFLESLPISSFYLIEPHPLLLASGLVQSFFSNLGIYSLSKGPSLGIIETPPPKSPLLRTLKVDKIINSFEKVGNKVERVKFFGVPKKKIIPMGTTGQALIVTKFKNRILGFLGHELV